MVGKNISTSKLIPQQITNCSVFTARHWVHQIVIYVCAHVNLYHKHWKKYMKIKKRVMQQQIRHLTNPAHDISRLRTSWSFITLPTPWNRDLPEKLTGPQGVRKIPRILWTPRRFITAFTRARHLFLSWARSIRSMPPSHFSNIHFNIIVPSMCVSFHQVTSPNPFTHLSSPP
jgi:hypothetical protein